MKLIRAENLPYITELINRFSTKGAVSNNYILPSELNSSVTGGNVLYCHSDSNLYLFLTKPGGFLRLYYILNDLQEIPSFDTSIPMMTEILFRGNAGIPENEIMFLNNAGFRMNLRRDQYSALATNIDGLTPEYAESLDIVSKAIRLFNESFDKYSGDFIPPEEMDRLLKEKRILSIVKENHKLAGALELSVTSRNAWISHLSVSPQYRRQGIADDLVKMFVQAAKERGAVRLMLWVQTKNEAAVSLYAKYGFKYTNKSTISLIKE